MNVCIVLDSRISFTERIFAQTEEVHTGLRDGLRLPRLEVHVHLKRSRCETRQVALILAEQRVHHYIVPCFEHKMDGHCSDTQIRVYLN